ncbi:MAG: response regulator [Muribaculaceae bacterium]|nr:response regulator [Muribaculaceae bacterium]
MSVTETYECYPPERALVIDGDDSLVHVIRVALMQVGFEVEVAHTVDEALALPLCDYDLFILDMKLEDMRGLQVAQKIRSSVLTADTPLIICSTNMGSCDIVRGLDAGADDYVSRTLQPVTFKARVHSLMRRHRGA